jgi:alanyl-tRNA synthetase
MSEPTSSQMSSQEIRRQFLNYFKSKGHSIVASSAVFPHDDPTILFTNAGMNQFKDVFLGQSKRDYSRATTSQKCIRVGGKHNDLENVGHTSRHLTFFEMLGNFSFGDYFKKEAIEFAWEVTTQVFGFDPEKVWASVYKDDDEAYKLWEKFLPTSRIVRFGEKENFWAMGDTGPCGPCSELLYDRGNKYGPAKSPTEDASGERYLEFWNLVFMQYSRGADGKLTDLPKQSIDTGAGLERVVSLKMGVDDVYKTDVLRSLIDQVEKISGKVYEESNAAPFHVIADHIRSLSFSIADGVQPSNTDRGYVLRKILRRAVRYGRMLGLQKPFLADLLPRLISLMGSYYPELKTSQERIAEILTLEEEAFNRTLQRGGQLLGQVMDRSRSSKVISGDDAFKLKDTYGFPLEEIELIAKDEGISVDMIQYEKLDVEAREKSRKAHKTASQEFGENFFSDFTAKNKPSEFVGYDNLKTEAQIVKMVVEGKFVDAIEEGQEALLILDKTPFYAEMGGQVGDSGTIGNFQVYDTTSPFTGVIAHLGKMGSGSLKTGDKVTAAVDLQRRTEIQNNHSATHILHWALQKVLGGHIKQAGSLVDDKRLRFDFSHHKSLSALELRQIEDLANEKVRVNEQVKCYELSYGEAQKRSDIKQFFGEKYGDKVRVVDIDFSKELCGGTHTPHVGTIGLIKIAKEASIAAGVRRIEAVTGRHAELLVQEEEDMLAKIVGALKATPSTLFERLEQVLDENKAFSLELKGHRKDKLKALSAHSLSKIEHVGDIAFIALEEQIDADEVGNFTEELLHALKSGVVAVGVKTGDRCQLVIGVTPDLVQKNVLASALIKIAAPHIEGGGGGKQTIAQAGGKKPEGMKAAFDAIRAQLKK